MYRTISRLLMTLILAALAGTGSAAADETMTPLERVASAPKGELKSPYTDFGSVAEEGHKVCEIFKTDTEIWKIIAWIRSANCERREAGC